MEDTITICRKIICETGDLISKNSYIIIAESTALGLKPRAHLSEYFFRLFKIEIHSAISNNLKPIGMMKMQCVTIYPNIYECISEDSSWPFFNILRPLCEWSKIADD